MAVTGFWPVFKNLKATLDYADNPDKTTAPEYLDEDLYAARATQRTMTKPIAKCLSAVLTARHRTPTPR